MYLYIYVLRIYIYIHTHTSVYTSPLILISFWVIESFFCEPHQLTSWYTGDAFVTSKEVDYGAVVWKWRVQTSILKSWVDHHQAAKQQHMYIYIYWIRSGPVFCCNPGILLWPVSTTQCNSKLCRSEILIKAQTKEVWPFLKKLGVGERSFFFHLEIVETG